MMLMDFGLSLLVIADKRLSLHPTHGPVFITENGSSLLRTSFLRTSSHLTITHRFWVVLPPFCMLLAKPQARTGNLAVSLPELKWPWSIKAVRLHLARCRLLALRNRNDHEYRRERLDPWPSKNWCPIWVCLGISWPYALFLLLPFLILGNPK